MSGQVVHFELPADDLARAKAFYRDALSWHLADVPEMGYTLASTAETDEAGNPTEPGTINGGMLARGEPVTVPVITVKVDDIEQALAGIEKLGGRVVQGKRAVGPMGFTAYFADTEGNVLGLWQDTAPE